MIKLLRLIVLLLVPTVSSATVYYVDTAAVNTTHATYYTASAGTTGCPTECIDSPHDYTLYSAGFATAVTISGTITWAGTYTRDTAWAGVSGQIVLFRASSANGFLSNICSFTLPFTNASGSIPTPCTATTTTVAVGEKLGISITIEAIIANGNATVTSINFTTTESPPVSNTGMMGFWGALVPPVHLPDMLPPRRRAPQVSA